MMEGQTVTDSLLKAKSSGVILQKEAEVYVPKEESESEDETNRSESENSYDAHAYDRDDPPWPSSVNSLPRSIQRRCAQHAAGPHRMPAKTPQASILNRTAKPKLGEDVPQRPHPRVLPLFRAARR